MTPTTRPAGREDPVPGPGPDPRAPAGRATGGGPAWPDLPAHRAWLDTEARRLTGFARGAALPTGGFGWLDADGRPDPAQPKHTWITARMTHVFALAALRGEPGAGPLADVGVAALRGPLRDADHGGWFAASDDDTKAAYAHAFVVLAASSALTAGRPGAAALLDDALETVDRRFWREDEGASAESWDRTWTRGEPYRGANSNMHLVEAFLAASDATGDPLWTGRALRIAERLVHDGARAADWRLPEHHAADWTPLPDYSTDERDHPFRPYGTTVGHWLEWSRLLVHLHVALGKAAPAWLVPDARALFDAAVRRGWAVDGADGFVYTLDWDDRPVVRARMHWVVAEAIGAAAVLHRATGDPVYARWYRTWWDHAARYFLDPERGSWHHELDAGNRPAAGTWAGKPDVYHAFQAVLLPQVPLAPSLAGALV